MTVRVGQNKKRYQQVLGRTEDLRTRPGVGKIVRIAREPTLDVYKRQEESRCQEYL